MTRAHWLLVFVKVQTQGGECTAKSGCVQGLVKDGGGFLILNEFLKTCQNLQGVFAADLA